MISISFDRPEILRFSIPKISLLMLIALGGWLPVGGLAAEGNTEKSPQAEAQTTADPTVPVDHLKLLVQPLTLEEVEVEVEAWRDLVRAKTKELNTAEIASRKKSKKVEAVEKVAASAERAEENTTVEQGADEIEKDAAATKEVKGALLNSLTRLREERTALIERFNVVVMDFEKKGGDPLPYRDYISAVSGLNVEVTDTTAMLALVKGWLTSPEGGIKWLKKVLTFAAIVFAFYLLALAVGKVVKKATSLSVGMSDLMRGFINRMVRRIILIIGVVVGLGAVGFNVGAMLALIGGGAFIIGFALQDTLGNLANGIMLLFHRPFDKGDFVEVAGIAGKVESVTLVSTHILTPDNKLMIVPNKKVWGDIITNVTGSSERRVDLIFGIGYEDDIDEAQQILESIVAENELVLAEPAPVIRVHELADSSVNFVCRPWTKTGDYWAVYWDVTRQVKQQFDQRGISIPYPQQDIHLHQVESDA